MFRSIRTSRWPTWKMNTERILTTLVILNLVLTSITALVLSSHPLSRDEAVELSRNSELVCILMEDAVGYSLEVHYMNKTQVNRARETNPRLQEIYPEDRSVWTITWYIHPEDAPSAYAHVVSHVIDAETGQILHEGTLGLR